MRISRGFVLVGIGEFLDFLLDLVEICTRFCISARKKFKKVDFLTIFLRGENAIFRFFSLRKTIENAF